MTLSQRAYISSIIVHFHLKSAPPTLTPMDVGTHLVQVEGNEGTKHPSPYKEIIGSLMYAATATQPDITFMISALAQFSQKPVKPHWEATKCIVRDLKGTRDLEFTYSANSNGTIRYTDADHTSQYHQHSIMGYAFLINGGVVSWSLKKQPLVALSTTKVEYIAAAHATKVALWL